MPGACRETQPLGRAREQGTALGIGLGDRRQQRTVGVGIATRLGPTTREAGQETGGRLGLDFDELALAIERSQPLSLDFTRRGDASSNIGGVFGGRWPASACSLKGIIPP